jgi:hypothetical protein
VIRSGKDCAAAYGVKKEALDRDAARICPAPYVEATAAALSGLAANRVG